MKFTYLRSMSYKCLETMASVKIPKFNEGILGTGYQYIKILEKGHLCYDALVASQSVQSRFRYYIPNYYISVLQ